VLNIRPGEFFICDSVYRDDVLQPACEISGENDSIACECAGRSAGRQDRRARLRPRRSRLDHRNEIGRSLCHADGHRRTVGLLLLSCSILQRLIKSALYHSRQTTSCCCSIHAMYASLLSVLATMRPPTSRATFCAHYTGNAHFT